MNTETLTSSPVSSDDRLATTLCLALVVHAVLILGVGFRFEPPSLPRAPSLDVILVQQQDPAPPEEVDYLAQANLQGGGESSAEERPTTTVPAPMTAPEPELPAAQPQPVAEPEAPNPPRPEPVVTAEAPAPVEQAIIAVEQDSIEAIQKTEPQAQQEEAAESPDSPPESEATLPDEHKPSASSLVNRSFAMASLNAEISDKMSHRAERPRRKFISANTREYRFASYMEAWRAKVERIGNLNYPDEARRQRLSGALIVSVDINPDGSLRGISIRKSSGHTVLDDAALRIIKLAAPFAPFPDTIAKDVDILNITRTWKFLAEQRFSRG